MTVSPFTRRLLITIGVLLLVSAWALGLGNIWTDDPTVQEKLTETAARVSGAGFFVIIVVWLFVSSDDD